MPRPSITKQDIDHFLVSVSRWRKLSKEDAEEVVSQALLVYAEKLARGIAIEKQEHWLMRTAGIIARRLVAERIQFNELLLDPEFPTRAEDEPSVVERVRQLVAGLRAPYRQADELCDMDGLTKKEAARALRLSYRTVQTRLSRAHKQLHDLIVAGHLVGTTLGTAG